MNKLPTLFIRTATGALQYWTIQAHQDFVHISYGQVDGTPIHTKEKCEAKNLGKNNYKSPEEQAVIRAKQLYDKKLKEGYVADINQAQAGENDLPGTDPMLAFDYEKKEKYIKYPCLVQPKLDGMRLIIIINNGKAKLFSRTRKEILTLPHLVEEAEKLFPNQSIILDGEAYTHELKHDFNRLMSLIKRDEVHKDSKLIQFHCYDVVGQEPWPDRNREKSIKINQEGFYFKNVDTSIANNFEMIKEYFSLYLDNNYEGLMIRDIKASYENKRSPYLLKYKEMMDEEFEIIGCEEGNGKLLGKLGAMVCKTKSGEIFKAKPNGSIEHLEELFKNKETLLGKLATIKFQGYTPKPREVPRFPVLKAIRED
jgi:ATP-dependent DNA ligase